MAEPVSVSVTRDSTGNVVSENVSFSDMANHKFTIVGLPGVNYNIATLQSSVQGVAITSSDIEADAAEQSISALFNTSMQPNLPSLAAIPEQMVAFTNIAGNTLAILGGPNAVYDLNVLNYLLAVIAAIDTFMTLQYGAAYESVKHDQLMLVNLE